MHSVIFALVAIAGLATAGPTIQKRAECPGSGAYYVCGTNGFRGYCSSDPCAKSWCPDFKDRTCEPIENTPVPKNGECPGSGVYYVCSTNGFRGYCSSDPCAKSWCPDFKDRTCEPIENTPVPKNGECPSGTGYFQVCGKNGFRGCCKTDACGAAWCPDYKPGTYQPVKTMKIRARQSDPTVCAPGAGYFQSCSNGFRGCCKKDACAQKTPVCPSN
ncbi:hypothetical protein B0J13DRAFT_631769 [Dactylonectria estremocensis]|uniref:Uncharacterized protein n=1 Tax=Dactylonectria estremocensis TaxID=1079267 RepID=A0A9P9I8E5_9HYPO|nr:hypothetical protein B0J13DRAFT_631769 [Dactylonectria estremocensis]